MSSVNKVAEITVQLAFVIVFALCGMGAPAHAGGYRIITDMDDRRI